MLNKKAKSAFLRLFGKREVPGTVRWNGRRGRPMEKTEVRITPERELYEQFVKSCYHGGRNECFTFGPSAIDVWNDYDLSGAYTTGLVDLRALDYGSAYTTRDPEAFKGHVCGFVRARFSFPKDTRFPCLPVDGGPRGLYYPLEGETFCTAAELEVALGLGADIEVMTGVVVPWCGGDERVFEPVMRLVREKRRTAKLAGRLFDERMYKEMGNSIYGKLAQAIVPKSDFDTRTVGSKASQPSALTNPYFAAHATGLIRAVISELLARMPPHRRVLSVTTDGFLTDAEEHELDQSGPMARRYQGLIDRLDGGSTGRTSPMLERKHRVEQVVAIKTRGQLTARACPGEPIVLAKTGVKPPVQGDHEQNRFMLDLFLDRVPGQRLDQLHLISTREQWATEADLVSVKRSLTLNLEPDFKRRLVAPRMVGVADRSHLALDSEPWPTGKDAERARALFDGWRCEHCLKTLEDFAAWEAYLAARLAAREKGVRVTGDGGVGLLRRMFLRAYTRGVWGVNPSMAYPELAAWLTAKGYPTSPSDVKNGKRGKLAEGVVPASRDVLTLLAVLLEGQPGLEIDKFFAADQLAVVAAWRNGIA